MKSSPLPELIWLSDFHDRCPLSGERIFGEEVELTIEGEDTLLVDWPLGRCEHSARWYGMLSDLLAVLADADVSLETVDGFLVDDEEVAAGVWVGEPAGVVPWEVVREQLAAFQAEPSGPPPSPEAARALPLLSESWELGVRPSAWFIDDEGAYAPSYVALVLDPAVGIRYHDLRGETPHTAPDLAALILEAAARPRAGAPGRPLEVCLDDEALAAALAEALDEADISVRAAPTPLADEVLEDMVRSLSKRDELPFFAPHDERTVRAFFQAAKAFYGVRPWDRIDGEKYVAFRLGDGPWSYLSVMGQMGEEFGLSYFEDWLQLCRFIHNQPSPYDYLTGEGERKAFEAAGALEGLTLEPLQAFGPEDAEYLTQLGIKPPRRGLYPFVRRFTLEGLEAPHLSMFDYQILMAALAETVAKRRARAITSIKQTVTVGEVPVTLRYPARGDEGLGENPGSYRLVVTGVKKNGGTVRIEIDAPGTARLDEVTWAVKREGGEGLWINAVTAGDYAVWDYNMGRGAPCPRVAHLAALRHLALEIFTDPYPLQVLPRMATGVSEIQVKFVG